MRNRKSKIKIEKKLFGIFLTDERATTYFSISSRYSTLEIGERELGFLTIKFDLLGPRHWAIGTFVELKVKTIKVFIT